MTRRKGPTPRVDRWGPWFEDHRSPLPSGDRLFGNGWWTVTVTIMDPEAGMAGPLHLSIHDRPRSVRHDWREFQRVKNELLGPEREAVELYPAESRLVDTANEYHLWVLEAGTQWPFGFTQRLTDDDEIGLAEEEEAMAAHGVDRAQIRNARQRKRVAS